MENIPQFKNGDIVKLKSGGPDMTINKIVEQPLFSEDGESVKIVGYVNCTWFEKSKMMSGKFHTEALKLVE